MKITKVQIDHFGQWQNQTFSFSDELQVISGLNGSGKTTLMTFIQGMLFGFPTAKAHENTYENKDTATIYGGRLWFHQDGVAYELSRHQRTNSIVTLKEVGNVEPFGDSEGMLQHLMSPMTADLYREIYQFNQDGLLEILMLKPADLLERLRVIGIPHAQGWLRQSDEWMKEAQASFGKTATSKRPINQKITHLAEAKATLHRMEQGLPEVSALESQIKELHNDVTDLQAQQTQQAVADQYMRVETQLQEVETWLANQPDKLDEAAINDVVYMQNYLTNPPISEDLERWYDIDRLLGQLSNEPVTTQQARPAKSNEPWIYMSVAVLIGFVVGALIGQTIIGTILGLLGACVIYWQYTEPTRTVERTSNLRDERIIEQLAYLGFTVNSQTNVSVARQKVAQQIGKLSHESESYQAMKQRLEMLYEHMGVDSDATFNQRREQTNHIVQQEQRKQLLQDQLADMTKQEMNPRSAEDLSEDLRHKHARIAQLEMQLERLSTDQSLRQQRQLVANWESELLTDLQDYFALQMAAQWTQQAFDAANNDRWPRLEQQSDHYMQTLTKGQYQHITWTEKTFVVTDYQDQPWDVRQLSRGTAQQLYVALRLAMIAELQMQVNMPLLIDDAFVDFDIERQAALLSLLRNQSIDQQVLYFTKDIMNEPAQLNL